MRRSIFTTGHFDNPAYGKIKKEHKGPTFHAGRVVKIRPVWMADNGAFRIGRTGDMIQMLTDLGVSDRSF